MLSCSLLIMVKEPEFYVQLGREHISLEVPPKVMLKVIERLATALKAEKITMRFDRNGKSEELHCTPVALPQTLRRYEKLIREEAVIIEYGPSTLYSNGGGCLFLETSVSNGIKKKIAQQVLELCGYSHRVKSNRFTALVRAGKLKVIELRKERKMILGKLSRGSLKLARY